MSDLPKTIWVVECSAGEWDGHHSWIGGVFDTKKAAEKAATDLDDAAKKIRDACPEERGDPDVSDDPHWDYYSKHTDEMEWCPSRVVEYPLNWTVTRHHGRRGPGKDEHGNARA